MTRRIRFPRHKPGMRRRGPRCAPRKSRQAGGSLIELLVALLVMGVGVLGVTGLQTLGMQSNRAALLHAEAAQLAEDMMERVRANSGDGRGAVPYGPLAFGDPPFSPPDCGAHHCTRAQMAVFDQAAWKCSLGGFPDHPVCAEMRDTDALGGLTHAAPGGLPDGDGAFALDASTGLVRVTVRWREGNRQRSVSIESRV